VRRKEIPIHALGSSRSLWRCVNFLFVHSCVGWSPGCRIMFASLFSVALLFSWLLFSSLGCSSLLLVALLFSWLLSSSLGCSPLLLVALLFSWLLSSSLGCSSLLLVALLFSWLLSSSLGCSPLLLVALLLIGLSFVTLPSHFFIWISSITSKFTSNRIASFDILSHAQRSGRLH
jgi:F0F1-type ATP synthase assembly protein I